MCKTWQNQSYPYNFTAIYLEFGNFLRRRKISGIAVEIMHDFCVAACFKWSSLVHHEAMQTYKYGKYLSRLPYLKTKERKKNSLAFSLLFSPGSSFLFQMQAYLEMLLPRERHPLLHWGRKKVDTSWHGHTAPSPRDSFFKLWNILGIQRKHEEVL